jgi:hypothetical protein
VLSGFPLQDGEISVELPFDFLTFQCESGVSDTQTYYKIPMINNEAKKEEWLKLCEQAAVEQDPERLMLLTREICRLLDEREKALKNQRLP